MSNDQPLTNDQIDQMIDALKAQRKALTGRTTKPKKIGVRLSCNLCGEMDTRDNLVRVSKSEYVHSACVTVTHIEIPRVTRKVFTVSIVFEDTSITYKEIVDTMTALFSGLKKVTVLTERVIEQ